MAKSANNIVHQLKKGEHIIIKIEETFLVFLFLSIIGVISIQVAGRYWLEIPTPWAEELARFLFVWITYLGAAVGTYYKENILIDLSDFIYGKLFKPATLRKFTRIISIVNILLIISFLVLFSVIAFGYLQSLAAGGQTANSTNISMLIPSSSILVGAVLIIFHLVIDLLEQLFQPEDDSMEVPSS